MSDHMIQVRTSILISATAWRDIRRSVGVKEVEPHTAVTIAAWFQSPGTVGKHLAGLASGCAVVRGDVLDDIAATRRDFPRDYDSAESNWLALDMLATFVANYVGE